MKILWLSANLFGYELLKEACKVNNNQITGIITLKSHSKTVMYDGIERREWDRFGLDVFEVEDINRESVLLKKLAPDLIVMCGWRQIISREILNIPTKGFVGFHPTLLPIGRGPAPIINSILEGFTVSGVTFYHVSSCLDDGDIIGQLKFQIKENDYANDIYIKIIKTGKKIIRIYFPKIIANTAPRIPQDKTKVTVFKKPTLNDNLINFDKESIEEIYKKIRALSFPYKGAYIMKDGKKLIIWKAELLN